MYGCRPSRIASTPSKSSTANVRRRLLRLYRSCYAYFGPLHWWPGDSAFEICIGAILTQNTAWTNVEKAIANLKAAKLLSVRGMCAAPPEVLAEAIRPSGYYNQKARKLRTFTEQIGRLHHHSIMHLLHQPLDQLRSELLAINGIGPETADSMILYAAEQPIFVVDAYTRRILYRLGLTPADIDYHDLQALFHRCLPPDVELYNEFHAQIVYLGKEFCRKTKPRCAACPARIRRGTPSAV